MNKIGNQFRCNGVYVEYSLLARRRLLSACLWVWEAIKLKLTLLYISQNGKVQA